jgi:adenylate kinase family enzyme
MRIVLIGHPGSGKSTLAKILLKEFKLSHIHAKEVPDNYLYQQLILDGYPSNMKQVKDLEKKGIDIDKLEIKEAERPYNQLFHQKYSDYVIYLDVSQEELIKRLIARGKDKWHPPEYTGRIDEDSDSTSIDLYEKAIAKYKKQVDPVIEYFKGRPGYLYIKAEGDTPENIAKEIINKIRNTKRMYTPKQLKTCTLLNLIDFEGNSLLSGDTALNNLRFSKLKKLLFETKFETKLPDLCIVSENLNEYGYMTKMNELKYEIKDRYNWLELPDTSDWKFDKANPFNSIKYIKKEFEGLGIGIKNVIVAGQNLPGCIFKTLDHSALRWAEQGHYVQIVLSMCGDYEVSGVGPERYMNSFASLYKQIKKSGQWANIDLVSEMKDIKYMIDGVLKCGE